MYVMMNRKDGVDETVSQAWSEQWFLPDGTPDTGISVHQVRPSGHQACRCKPKNWDLQWGRDVRDGRQHLRFSGQDPGDLSPSSLVSRPDIRSSRDIAMLSEHPSLARSPWCPSIRCQAKALYTASGLDNCSRSSNIRLE